MGNNDLQVLIEQIESSNSREEAYFGIFEYGGGSDESYIKANKQGLELFAATLLRAAVQIDHASSKNENIDIAYFTDDWISEDCTTYIIYIEPFLDLREKSKTETYNKNWKNKLMPIGCLSVVILAVISSVIGFVTILNWLIS